MGSGFPSIVVYLSTIQEGSRLALAAEEFWSLAAQDRTMLTLPISLPTLSKTGS
jgi:hypothetical protein